MYRNRAHRVIDPEPAVHECNRRNDDQATNEADDRREQRGGRQRLRGDRDQAGQRAVQRHREIGLAEPQSGENERGDKTTGSRHVRVDEDQCDGVRLADVGHLQLRTAVEAEPSEPQDQCAERRERQVGSRNRVHLSPRTVFAFTRAENQHAGQRRRCTAHVHHARTREVQETQFVEESATPLPEALHGVNEARQHHREREECPELHPLGDGAGHDRHCGRDEHDLEEKVGEVRVVGVAGDDGVDRIIVRAQQADAGNQAARIPISRVHDPVSAQHVHDACDRVEADILRQNLGRVLGAHQARLQHREAGRHPHDERAAHQEIKGIERVT